eukprot:gene8620-13330_t
MRKLAAVLMLLAHAGAADEVSLRLTTDTQQYSGTADTFFVLVWNYTGGFPVARVSGAAAGEVVVVRNATLPFAAADATHVSVESDGTGSDGWLLASVDLYRENGGWRRLHQPESGGAGGAVMVKNEVGLRELAFFDFNPQPTAHEIATFWRGSPTNTSAGTFLVFYHSARGDVCFGGAIYTPAYGDVWPLTATNCRFPREDLTSVTINGLRHKLDSWGGVAWEVSAAFLVAGDTRLPLVALAWGGGGGAVGSAEVVLEHRATRAPATDAPVTQTPGTPAPMAAVEVRITTAASAGAGSAGDFEVMYHFHNETIPAATVSKPLAPGAARVVSPVVSHSARDLVSVSIRWAAAAAGNPWVVAGIEVYRDGVFSPMTSLRAQTSVAIGGGGASAAGEAAWVALAPRPPGHTVETVWKTDAAAGSETADGFLVFLHSGARAHFAGAAWRVGNGEIRNITTGSSPFPAASVTEVSVRGAPGNTGDAWRLRSVGIVRGGTLRRLFCRGWDGFAGSVGGAGEALVFAEPETPAPGAESAPRPVEPAPGGEVFFRVKTEDVATADSSGDFRVRYHFYGETVDVAVISAPGLGDAVTVAAE